jgi:acyl dehydratase
VTDDGTTDDTQQEPLHLGKWFEELTPGLRIRHAFTRTLTESDNLLFCGMTMNPAAIHVDFEAAAKTIYGKPLVNSLLTLGLVVGLSIPEATHGTTVANLGFQEVTFPAPLFAGDTIHVVTEVLSARPSASRPDTGIVVFQHEAFNQRDELVCKAVRSGLQLRRPT